MIFEELHFEGGPSPRKYDPDITGYTTKRKLFHI
jgi:hypothetical protein